MECKQGVLILQILENMLTILCIQKLLVFWKIVLYFSIIRS